MDFSEEAVCVHRQVRSVGSKITMIIAWLLLVAGAVPAQAGVTLRDVTFGGDLGDLKFGSHDMMPRRNLDKAGAFLGSMVLAMLLLGFGAFAWVMWKEKNRENPMEAAVREAMEAKRADAVEKLAQEDPQSEWQMHEPQMQTPHGQHIPGFPAQAALPQGQFHGQGRQAPQAQRQPWVADNAAGRGIGVQPLRAGPQNSFRSP